MAKSLVALKFLFSVVACVMAAALTYGLLMDGFSSCFDPHARWMQVVTTDFAIDVSLIGAWFFYKESGWIIRVLYIITVFLFGSAVICGYIVMLLFKLTPEESSKDPIYFVLARRQKWDNDMGYKRAPSALTARVIVAALGCLMIGALIYAFVGDGSPFHMKVLTPCMVTALTDIKIIHIVVFSVWIAYKESSWITAFFWALSVSCFGSIGVCAYIMRELFCLSPEQPIYLILFSKSNSYPCRNIQSSDPLLMASTSV